MERAARRLGARRGGAERAEGGRCGAGGRKMAEPETQLLLGVGLIGTGRPGGGEARAVAG
mgnify:CR=1 FL=1